jgi:hypothetical protein
MHFKFCLLHSSEFQNNYLETLLFLKDLRSMKANIKLPGSLTESPLQMLRKIYSKDNVSFHINFVFVQ